MKKSIILIAMIITGLLAGSTTKSGATKAEALAKAKARAYKACNKRGRITVIQDTQCYPNQNRWTCDMYFDCENK